MAAAGVHPPPPTNPIAVRPCWPSGHPGCGLLPKPCLQRPPWPAPSITVMTVTGMQHKTLCDTDNTCQHTTTQQCRLVHMRASAPTGDAATAAASTTHYCTEHDARDLQAFPAALCNHSRHHTNTHKRHKNSFSSCIFPCPLPFQQTLLLPCTHKRQVGGAEPSGFSWSHLLGRAESSSELAEP